MELRLKIRDLILWYCTIARSSFHQHRASTPLYSMELDSHNSNEYNSITYPPISTSKHSIRK